MTLRSNYKATIHACYTGYITQAVVNSFAPLLFVTFQKEYGIPLAQITFLITFNFGFQLVIDLLSAKFVDKIGWRTSIVAAHICAALGLILLGILPHVLSNAFVGLLISVIIYAIGGGLIEVLISPIVEACPTDDKTSAMSLLHSFYCWGVVAVTLISTLFFHIFSIHRWPILAFLWAILPIVNGFVFSIVPISTLTEQGKTMSVHQLLFQPLFWMLFVLMICAGASEQAMSQWASAFAESGMHVSKTVADLAGPCLFSFLMGLSRVIHANTHGIDIRKYLIFSALLCIIGYCLASLTSISWIGLAGCGIVGFAVGAMWPGSFSIAARQLPTGGTALFALLALGGDLGCNAGPTLTGMISAASHNNLQAGLLAAIIFPAVMAIMLAVLQKRKAA